MSRNSELLTAINELHREFVGDAMPDTDGIAALGAIARSMRETYSKSAETLQWQCDKRDDEIERLKTRLSRIADICVGKGS